MAVFYIHRAQFFSGDGALLARMTEGGKWLVQNELTVLDSNLQQTDPGKYRQLRIRLQHLKTNKSLQKGIYVTGLSRIVTLLELFDNSAEH